MKCLNWYFESVNTQIKILALVPRFTPLVCDINWGCCVGYKWTDVKVRPGEARSGDIIFRRIVKLRGAGGGFVFSNLNSHVKENTKGCRVKAVAVAAAETGAGGLILKKKVGARRSGPHVGRETAVF